MKPTIEELSFCLLRKKQHLTDLDMLGKHRDCNKFIRACKAEIFAIQQAIDIIKGDGVVLDVLDKYDAETDKIPLGLEDKQKGASVYNWRRSIISDLKAMIQASQKAEE